ncbi:MAG: hypothetical protein R2851_08340 [Caldilineaceae bacterium]
MVDGEIVPTNPNITRTECDTPAGVMEQEDTFVGALANATAYAVDGTTWSSPRWAIRES